MTDQLTHLTFSFKVFSVITFLEIWAQNFSFRMKAFLLAYLFRNILRRNLCRILRSANHYHHHQELITRSLHLPHVPVAAFSQTDLFLV